MPAWKDKWVGGRYYLDELGQKVFFIEKMREGVRYNIKLDVDGDEDEAEHQFKKFKRDPKGFVQAAVKKALAEQQVVPTEKPPVHINTYWLDRYFAKLRAKKDGDHRSNRLRYLVKWSDLGLDLRTTSKQDFEKKLAEFPGGHRWLTEGLNAFGRFMVKEGQLEKWAMIENTTPPKEGARSESISYTIKQLRAAWEKLKNARQGIRDVFLLRVATGMHHTEIEQLAETKWYEGPLPKTGLGIRRLDSDHEIVGVIQIRHKSLKKGKPKRHRLSLNKAAFEAAVRLRDAEYVPDRWQMRDALLPLLPSNFRHTFITLSGECGKLVEYDREGGVDRARIAQIVGHAAGSTMIDEHYENMQVPPMMRLPLGFP